MSKTKKVIVTVVTYLIAAIFICAVLGLLWNIWLFVIPTMFPTMSHAFKTPTFLQFIGLYTLIASFGYAINSQSLSNSKSK